ncbi:hypothetical protein ACFYNL_29595 [Streptomyces sp. NPDC007808]|uniref:hypothetical protein n=1 Tax=Streptomyces sp. NPDC007808 TaxID=3364779 RepID=UPI0036AC934A
MHHFSAASLTETVADGPGTECPLSAAVARQGLRPVVGRPRQGLLPSSAALDRVLPRCAQAWGGMSFVGSGGSAHRYAACRTPAPACRPPARAGGGRFTDGPPLRMP